MAASKVAPAVRVTLCVALSIACASCSRAVRVSPLEPEALTQIPGSGKSPRFIRTDSVRTQYDGVLVVSGDSIRVYSRLGGAPRTTPDTTSAIYGWDRTASQLRVMGYQPAAGPWRAWEVSVRARGDSLEFLRDAPTHPLRATAGDTLRVSRQALERVDLDEVDPVRTTVTITVAAAVILGLAIASVANFFHPGSGVPTIY